MVINYEKCASKAQALQTVKASIVQGLLKKFQVKADITDNGVDEMKAVGKGFNLAVSFNESDLEVSLKLSLFLRPFKGKIEHILQKEIRKVI